jgi:4-nitrophenyl phosphatase
MIRGVFLDLDGTVYWGTREVPGAADFIRKLRGLGIAYLFVTNRANRPPVEIRDHLRRYGIPCEAEDVLTAAQATAASLKPGRAWFIGEDGMRLALEEAGFQITEDRPDYVIVSFDRTFDYNKLKIACRLIGNGAQFIATNPDQALRTEDGLLPGTGAIVAAVAAGTGKQPVMIGKPEKTIFEMGLRRLGIVAGETIAVGDNPGTDIPAGARAGIRTAYILTGVGRREDLAGLAVQPTWVVEGFAELSDLVERER